MHSSFIVENLEPVCGKYYVNCLLESHKLIALVLIDRPVNSAINRQHRSFVILAAPENMYVAFAHMK